MQCVMRPNHYINTLFVKYINKSILSTKCIFGSNGYF